MTLLSKSSDDYVNDMGVLRNGSVYGLPKSISNLSTVGDFFRHIMATDPPGSPQRFIEYGVILIT
jgi:hypothetical protein